MKGEQLIVVVTTDPLAGVTEDVCRAIQLIAPRRANRDKRTIRGTAADVDDQHRQLPVHARFEFHCRRHGLIEKGHLAEATGAS